MNELFYWRLHRKLDTAVRYKGNKIYYFNHPLPSL